MSKESEQNDAVRRRELWGTWSEGIDDGRDERNIHERRLDRIRAAWPGPIPDRLVFVYETGGFPVGVLSLPRLPDGWTRFDLACCPPRSLRAAEMPKSGPMPLITLEAVDDSPTGLRGIWYEDELLWESFPLIWAVVATGDGGRLENCSRFHAGLADFAGQERRILERHPNFGLNRAIQHQLDYLPRMNSLRFRSM